MNNEDIKVLEELLNENRRFFRQLGSHFYLDETIMQTIENLIKGYKELEEIKQQKLDKYLYKNQWICKDLAENYIHKSKVREIIEDIDNSQPVIAELKLRKLIEGDTNETKM